MLYRLFHEDGVRVLMSFVFPELTEDEIPGRAWAPFAPGPFFATPKYREIFAAELPGIPVSISYDVLPKWKEYERATTTITEITCHARGAVFLDPDVGNLVFSRLYLVFFFQLFYQRLPER